jgi:nucleoside-diphosphate-sugar epimerase
MRILVTGADGYIGCVLIPLVREAGHVVVGLDNNLFSGCSLGEFETDARSVSMDVRDVEQGDLEGFDAIIHLAAVSNDPIGDLNPSSTYEINYEATVRLARLAKQAGVERFLFSSSCSLYGAAADRLLDETADFNPVTPYGESKVLAERELSKLADDSFSPTYLRNGTAYGLSPRLRADLVLNNLVGLACTTGEVRMQSDGSPWRPLVHIRDITAAFLAALDAPRDAIHDEAFNVGRDDANYQIREIAEIVEGVVAGSRVTLAKDAAPDPRSYRVSFGKITERLPDFRPAWTAKAGAIEVRDGIASEGLGFEAFSSSRFVRIKRVRELIDAGVIDATLRRGNGGAPVSPAQLVGQAPADDT